jgi:hypothetical protein
MQTRQAARLFHARIKHFLLEVVVVQLHHFDLQILAGTKVGEHAGLAHVHLVREQTDGQALQTVAAGQIERHIENCGARKFAFAHEFRCRVGKLVNHGSPAGKSKNRGNN